MAVNRPEIAVLLLAGVAYLLLLALGLFVTYWIIRLAVRHGSLDARRRWRDDEESVQRQLGAEGFGTPGGPQEDCAAAPAVADERPRGHGGAMTVVVVTGASRGMGALTARRLAEQGCTVFAGARHPEAVADQLRRDPVVGDLRPLALDVTDDASVASAAQEVEEATGVVDVVINNAGVAGTWAGPADVGPEDFREVLDVNVLGPVRVTRAFLPLLLRAERPRLVMVSSGMGSFAHQTRDPVYADIAHLPYPASKAALDMLVVQYAKALPQVLVTAVDPGLTATELTGGTGHTVAEGAAPIIAAALDTVGPSGRFVDADGAAGW